jgi:hypothetical protein
VKLNKTDECLQGMWDGHIKTGATSFRAHGCYTQRPRDSAQQNGTCPLRDEGNFSLPALVPRQGNEAIPEGSRQSRLYLPAAQQNVTEIRSVIWRSVGLCSCEREMYRH